MADEIIKNCLDLDLEPSQVEAIEKLTTDEKAKQGIHGAIKVLGAFKDHITPAHVNQMANIAGLKKPDADDDDKAPKDQDDDSDSDDDEDDDSSGSGDASDDADKSDDGDADADDDDEDDGGKGKAGKSKTTKKRGGSMKDIPPAVQAQLDSIRKQAEADRAEKVELQKALQKERDARIERECIEKAQREFPNLGDAKKLGPIIRKMQASGCYDDIRQVLKAADEQARSAALFSERGQGSSPDTGTPADRLNQATQAVAKRDKVSLAKAMQVAIDEDPSLYDEYRTEQRRRAREEA